MWECIWGFFNYYSGALTLIVTVIYVVATIKIFKANKKSAEIAEDQLRQSKKELDELKNQFEESQRLSCQPFLQIEKISSSLNENLINIFLPIYYEESDDFSYPGSIRQNFVIKNLGNGNAINVFYSWDDFTGTHKDTCSTSINAIMHGDTYEIRIVVDPKIKSKSCLCFHYNDLIGSSYIQKFFINIDNNIINIENSSPVLE